MNPMTKAEPMHCFKLASNEEGNCLAHCLSDSQWGYIWKQTEEWNELKGNIIIINHFMKIFYTWWCVLKAEVDQYAIREMLHMTL